MHLHCRNTACKEADIHTLLKKKKPSESTAAAPAAKTAFTRRQPPREHRKLPHLSRQGPRCSSQADAADTGHSQGQGRCRYCLEEIIYSGDYSKACGSTAAGVKRTLRLLGCRSHPAHSPRHHQVVGKAGTQLQAQPSHRPEPPELPSPSTCCHRAGKGCHQLLAT